MQVGVIYIHNCAIGESGYIIVGYSVLTMDMTKQVQAWRHLRNPLQQFLRAIVEIVVKVQNAIWRCMGD